MGVGLWHPDADALFKIRTAIVEKSIAWVNARDDKIFQGNFSPAGDALINAPRGFAKDHPLREDIKRKDFISLARLSDTQVTSKNFLAATVARFEQATPYMHFLCRALDLRF